MLIAILTLLFGLLLLYLGAEYLVKGSSSFALSFGIRPLVIGMTIVALATSMPEMMVSLAAVIKKSSDLAAGNVIGSNIANIGLILGTTALLAPMTVARSTLIREIPIMLFASGVVFLMALDGELGRFDGLLLVLGLILFLGYCFVSSRKKKSVEMMISQDKIDHSHRRRDLLLILGGIVGLGIGAELMVRSAVFIARDLGVSDLVVGVTVVALGTSLPELAASTVSAWKGEADLSVGNVIGSNIFNLFFVLGCCALVAPIRIDLGILHHELPLMLVFSVALWLLVMRRLRLGRTEGVLLLLAYVVFISFYFI
ncbi:MAG: calcium/sodium antiporter [Geopsychrobacter sp.]|nr:calcium/sodium antiporter [Geopsychrobacter sp.]